jgi:hypothetical protein
MISHASGYTATLLPNGKVLIAGGNTASAELYDPATGTFTATSDMMAARTYHSATLLPSGKVLIAGGALLSPTSAELYDPSTGTFSPTGGMVQPQDGGTAVLLADGKVLIAHDTPSSAAGEIYDPITGTFSPTGNQPLTWFGTQQGALLADGRVVLVYCCRAEHIYDPASGTFVLTGVMTNVYPDGFASALPASGKFLVTGGFLEETNTPSAGACLYDPVNGTFGATGNMTTARYYHTATALGDGTVLIAGGEVSGHILLVTASAELYDPATGTFSPTGDMTTARMNHTATLLQDGTVLVAGGGTAGTEIYHPARPVPAPALFPIGGDAQGQGAIWHSNTGEIASAANPAVAGEALSMYTTSLFEGGLIPPQVAIGGQLAETLFFGDAPGYPGYNQVNFRMPSGVAPAPVVPVRLTYLGRPSNEVTIAVQ